MPFVAVKTDHATALNRGIMRLLRPAHLRGSDWTDLFCGMITHPTLPYTVLCLPDSFLVPIHVAADGAELAEILAVFVEDDAITQQEASGIIAAVQVMAGQQVDIADFIPPSWSDHVITEQQLVDGGWISSYP